MSKRVPYLFYGMMLLVCMTPIHAGLNPHAIFAIGSDEKPTTTYIPFSQLAPITYRNRPSLQSFIEEINRSKDLEKKELSLAFPQIAVIAKTAKTDFQLALESAFPHRYITLQIRQVVWSFAGPLQQYRIQRSSTSIAEETERFHRDTIRLESELSFFDALLSIKRKNRIKALDTSSKSVIAQGATRNQVGFLSATMWSQFRSNFASDQAIVYQYDDEVKTSFSFLERSLGIPLMSNIQQDTPQLVADTGLLVFQLNPLETYLDNAIHCRKDVAIKAWEVDRAEKTSSVLLNSYAPEIQFSFDIQRNVFATETNPHTLQINFQFGLDLSWKFDSFASAHESSATDAEILSLKMQQLDLALEIQRDVKAAYHELESLLKEVEAEKARYETAERRFKLREHEFQLGLLSEVDFKLAETDWEVAQYTLEERKINAEKKHRELLFACGYPPELE